MAKKRRKKVVKVPRIEVMKLGTSDPVKREVQGYDSFGNPVYGTQEKNTLEIAGTSINIPSVEDEVVVRRNMPIGKASKLPLTLFVFLMFEKNELDETKMTDEQMSAVLVQEFGHSDRFMKQVEKCRVRKLIIYRSLYQLGRLAGRQPKFISFRYNSKGQPVSGHGRTLTQNDINKIVVKHYFTIQDPRFPMPKTVNDDSN